MAEFRTKRNDTKPIQSQLFDENGDAVVLTGATVVFTMQGPDGLSNKKVNRGAVTISDANLGLVSYPWQSGETDTAGRFKGEYEVTYADGTKETFPVDGNLFISIGADLDET